MFTEKSTHLLLRNMRTLTRGFFLFLRASLVANLVAAPDRSRWRRAEAATDERGARAAAHEHTSIRAHIVPDDRRDVASRDESTSK